jgi:hypothetical protein
LRLVERARAAITAGSYERFRAGIVDVWGGGGGASGPQQTDVRVPS